MEEIELKNGEFLHSIKKLNNFYIGKFNIKNYINGRCHLFALVAHKLTGKDIHILCKPDYHYKDYEENLSRDILISHVYIDLGEGYAWDASGIHKVKNLTEDFLNFEKSIYENNDIQLNISINSNKNIKRIMAMMSYGLIATYIEEENISIKKYIKDFISVAIDNYKIQKEAFAPFYKLK